MPLFIKSNTALSSPLVGTPVIPPQPITSDSFNRADGPLAGNTDVFYGGVPKVWAAAGPASAMSIVGNQLVCPSATGTFFNGFLAGQDNYKASFKMLSLGGTVYLDVRRAAASVATSQDAIRLNMTSSGIRVQKRVAGVITSYGAIYPVAAGQRIAIEVKGDKITLSVDDVIKEVNTVTDSTLMTGGYVGWAGSTSTTSVIVDDFILDYAA